MADMDIDTSDLRPFFRQPIRRVCVFKKVQKTFYIIYYAAWHEKAAAAFRLMGDSTASPVPRIFMRSIGTILGESQRSSLQAWFFPIRSL